MILGVYGYSKSGKTTFIEKLLKILVADGYDIATIKHIPHEGFSIDTEKKDTWRYRNAGVNTVVASSPGETVFMINEGMQLNLILQMIQTISKPDLILVEGYKNESIPKIALGQIEERPNTIFRYEDNLEEILQYIKRELDIERILRQLPGIDCKKCGFDCRKMAELIYAQERVLEDCRSFSQLPVFLEADGKSIPLGGFTRDMIANIINGMISSLKGTEGAREFKIILRR
ncbi:MAG: molybdopterin-guanine dinucleotide biosynthesis protein B [Methanocellales archaeon]|nr:molybdopterin-guanine dinucleotide biosynthesis protein B [Methanocellales archaeon]MDD3291691.1 molybdopterin-guanine dinucleotide biosynthesis protein B [Methanocellales archaeon]MDD5235041.1 molybdopterin-guanine dinucleotide biosynthesis protein B [Methanocellales archaeon]MDD5485179.1 molybdopterin-guanine dinucleotide biosynthesis protein B [Methanocellales archaeon]